jgi:hypothetical protein
MQPEAALRAGGAKTRTSRRAAIQEGGVLESSAKEGMNDFNMDRMISTRDEASSDQNIYPSLCGV